MGTPDRKRARASGRAFEDYTVAELREAVAARDELAEELSELKSAGHVSDDKTLSSRISQAVYQQFMQQMLRENQLSEREGGKLRDKDGGREIVAYVPNVTEDALDSMGLNKYNDDNGRTAINPTKRTATLFQNGEPTKRLPDGSSLRISKTLGFKYVKASRAMTVTATYKWVAKPKEQAKAKPKAGKRKAGDDAGGEEDAVAGDDAGAEEADAEESAGDGASEHADPKDAEDVE